MKIRTMLVAGIAGGVGYVLGAKAGRERYEEIKDQATNLLHSPQVQETVTKVTEETKDKASDLSDKASDVADQAEDRVDQAKDRTDSGSGTGTDAGTGYGGTGTGADAGTGYDSTGLGDSDLADTSSLTTAGLTDTPAGSGLDDEVSLAVDPVDPSDIPVDDPTLTASGEPTSTFTYDADDTTR